MKAGATKTGYPVSSVKVPANALGPKQPREFYAQIGMTTNSFFSDASMPEEVAYEIEKLVYEHYKDWQPYINHLMFITPKTMGFTPCKTEDAIHPGTLKLLKEKNLEIFINGRSPLPA